MQWFRLLLAFAFLGAAGVCFIETRGPTVKNDKGLETRLQFLESLTRSANQEVHNLIEQKFRQLDDQPKDILTRWKKHDYTYQSLLNAAGSPVMIWMEGHRVRASNFKYETEFVEAMEQFSKDSGQNFDLKQLENRSFIFYRGFFKGMPYVAAFALEDFFHFLVPNQSLLTWIARADGKILYHPTARFWGESALNLRPVANGSAALVQGKEWELFEKFSSADSQEVWGVWSTMPTLQLIIATEWRGGGDLMPLSEQKHAWQWLTGIFIFLASLSFIASLLGDAGQKGQGPSVRAANPPEFLQHQLEVLKCERDEALASLETLKQWKEIQNHYDALFSADTAKQVWSLSLDWFARQTGVKALVFYKFLNASCSLVPEESRGLSSLDNVSQRFWSDTRIFIGSAKNMDRIQETDAFTKWDLTRQRFSPDSGEFFLFLPVKQGNIFRACICLHLEQESDRWLAGKQELIKSLVNRTTYLYEQKQRLLELKDAKYSRRGGVEGQTNLSRSESNPS